RRRPSRPKARSCCRWATPAASPSPWATARACPWARPERSSATSSSRSRVCRRSCRTPLPPSARRTAADMADARVTNPLVEQFRRGGVPKELRLMAAQGALPLKPERLPDLLTDLLHDAEAAVKETAEKSLKGFPAAEFLPILKSRETPSAVLAWGVTHRSDRELREAALQNTSLSDEAIEAIAAALPEELAELVVINQTRLLRRTSLLEAIQSNP